MGQTGTVTSGHKQLSMWKSVGLGMVVGLLASLIVAAFIWTNFFTLGLPIWVLFVSSASGGAGLFAVGQWFRSARRQAGYDIDSKQGGSERSSNKSSLGLGGRVALHCPDLSDLDIEDVVSMGLAPAFQTRVVLQTDILVCWFEELKRVYFDVPEHLSDQQVEGVAGRYCYFDVVQGRGARDAQKDYQQAVSLCEHLHVQEFSLKPSLGDVQWSTISTWLGKSSSICIEMCSQACYMAYFYPQEEGAKKQLRNLSRWFDVKAEARPVTFIADQMQRLLILQITRTGFQFFKKRVHGQFTEGPPRLDLSSGNVKRLLNAAFCSDNSISSRTKQFIMMCCKFSVRKQEEAQSAIENSGRIKVALNAYPDAGEDELRAELNTLRTDIGGMIGLVEGMSFSKWMESFLQGGEQGHSGVSMMVSPTKQEGLTSVQAEPGADAAMEGTAALVAGRPWGVTEKKLALLSVLADYIVDIRDRLNRSSCPWMKCHEPLWVTDFFPRDTIYSGLNNFDLGKSIRHVENMSDSYCFVGNSDDSIKIQAFIVELFPAWSLCGERDDNVFRLMSDLSKYVQTLFRVLVINGVSPSCASSLGGEDRVVLGEFLRKQFLDCFPHYESLVQARDTPDSPEPLYVQTPV